MAGWDMRTKEGAIDRLAPRGRPEGTPVMHQRWENLLFLHWPISPEVLKTVVPTQFEIDTFDGQAWIGITPFHLEDVHATGLPPLLGTGSFNEINVRTYVIHKGVPGIWFFSLDASKTLPAVGARALFMLPYFKAQIRYTQGEAGYVFSSRRPGPPKANFSVSWTTGQRLRDPDKDSLAFFLVERYACFAVENGTVYQVRINHAPWVLEEAKPKVTSSSLIAAAGLPEPVFDPLAHFSRVQNVDLWPPVPSKPLPKPQIKLESTRKCR